MNIGFTELLIIGAIAVLLFGSRLPKVGRSLGEGIRSFKKGLASDDVAPEDRKPRSGTANQATPPGSGVQQPVTVERPRVSMQSAPVSLTGGSSYAQGNQGTTARPGTVVDAEAETAPKKENPTI